jgi:hypothetical protein
VSQPLIYVKPLTMEEKLLIETVTARYEGIGESWVAFDRGDHIELRCPNDIRMSEQRVKQLKAKVEKQSAEA